MITYTDYIEIRRKKKQHTSILIKEKSVIIVILSHFINMYLSDQLRY